MLTSELTTKVYQRDGWKCRHCSARAGLHPHHVIYRSRGGLDSLDNLISMCSQCHIDGVHGGKLLVHIIEVIQNRDVIVRFERLKGWRPK